MAFKPFVTTTTATITAAIFGPGRRVPKTTLVVVLLVISSPKIAKAFLICSRAQRNFAYAFVLSADIPQRSTVSDLLYFSCIIKVRLNAGAVRLAVVRSDEYLCTGDKRGLP